MFKIHWDHGTAYDFFVSLYVLHRPADFGLRPSWAAGVRSRLPAPQRDLLEKAQTFLNVPLGFLHNLQNSPKNSTAALAALEAIAPAQRLEVLSLYPDRSPEAVQVLHDIAADGSYNMDQLEILRTSFTRRGQAPRPNVLTNLCDAWSNAEGFGAQYLEALAVYQQVFFAEEEMRIAPALESGLAHARELAERLPVPDLLAELSHGVHFAALPDVPQLILAPSYWSTPLVFYRQVSQDALVLLFGCRPAHQTLVPGENVPDGVTSTLRALDDPSRLRILRYLAEAPSTPSELARRLRLRPPTVVHHLSILRLAGLVEVTVLSEGERRYALRRGAYHTALAELNEFIFRGDTHNA